MSSSSALATPLDERSEQLMKSGSAEVGKPMPFFAGWTIEEGGGGQTFNLTRLLRKKSPRYVVTICASWCKPCLEGLTRIQNAKDRFKENKVTVVALVADSAQNAREKIYKPFQLKWATFIVDEFKIHVSKLCPNSKNEGGLTLPRTFVLDRSGKILHIIGREGKDYIKILTGEQSGTTNNQSPSSHRSKSHTSTPQNPGSEVYDYHGPRGQERLSLTEIIKRVKAAPNARHLLWKSGWSKWKSWDQIKYLKENM